MRKPITYILFFLVITIVITAFAGCEQSKDDIKTPLPECLRGQTFVYDELETGEGTVLYTLRFTDSDYYLNQDGGTGVIAHGTAYANEDKTLVLEGANEITDAVYGGSAFEETYAELVRGGRKMRFSPAAETTEYVYLSYLGTFFGKTGDKNAILVLERWHEWYLYTDGKMLYGTYEIFADGKIELNSNDGKVYSGSITKDASAAFDLRKIKIDLTVDDTTASFTFCEAGEKYDAAHAMGTYTLSLYPEDVFEIHGIDGFLKAFGTLKDGEVTYFQRNITNRVEEKYSFTVTKDGDTYYFPETTPLLPRSGNISKDTGFGSYWNAGTKLEFIKQAIDDDMPAATELFPKAEVTGKNNYPDFGGGLKAVMPTVGTARPLVLLIDFPDQHRPRHVTAENIESALFSLDDSDSLSAFYYRSSYGKLFIDGKVYGWYRMKRPRTSYESDSEIMREAVGYYINNSGLNLADFDADNDGVVDSLYILWAGNMESGTGMWDSAYRSTWVNSPEEWGRKVTGYIFVPGSTIWSSVPPLKCNTNSLIHETGHLLGLNDYYSYDTSERKNRDGSVYTGGALEGGLGGMDMMDTNIGDHNIFSKWLLGWAEPVVIEYADIASLDGQTYRLHPSALSGDGIFIKLKNEDSMYTELLVIEAVSPVLNFAEYSRLVGPVVRILHVETSVAVPDTVGGWRGFGFKYDNSYTSTKYIGIIEADGNDSVLNFVPSNNGEKISYEEADYFHAGDMLTPDTYPNTNAYDEYGNASVSTGLCIYIDEIEADGTAVIRLAHSEEGKSLHLTDITPSAQIVPYQRGEDRTFSASTETIHFAYDKKIAWAITGSEKQIKVYSDQRPVEGVNASLNGNQLIISIDVGFETNKAYTVVIPAGILSDTDNGRCLNNFNGIYGFVTTP